MSGRNVGVFFWASISSEPFSLGKHWSDASDAFKHTVIGLLLNLKIDED
jgi:hypothetical protein